LRVARAKGLALPICSIAAAALLLLGAELAIRSFRTA
jgi:hypothetical protein